jgi:PAS domain S-box-containing protein/putative nucleotidyltransferase with HDIG domain
MTPAIRLLYVEDNPQDADLTRALFASHAPEFEIEIVGTGRECLERLRETRFDLLLLDHHLPDMDGLDVIKGLSDADSQVPVVLVTGVGDEELVVKALRLGAANYVPKRGGYLETLPNVLRGEVEQHRQSRSQRMPVAASRQRILYVEHLPMDIELTLRHLAEAAPHFAVDVVRTCAEALARLEQPRAYDLALVDLRMPDSSGLDFVREAKYRRLPLPPFIMISGQGDEGAAIAALKLGAGDYIVKRNGYLNQLPHAIGQAIAHNRLDRINTELRVELGERKRVAHQLNERVKELRAFHRLAEITGRDGTTLGEVCEELTNILPESWQFPEITCARIRVGDSEFRTGNFADSPWEQSAPVRVAGVAVGSIDVGYLDERPEEDEGPFLKEERQLIDGLAERLGRVVERKRADEILRVKDWVIESAINAIAISDLAGSLSYVNPAFVRQWGYGSPAEILGRSVVEFWQMGDKAEEVAEAVRAKGSWSGDLVAQRKDGVHFDVHVASNLVLDAAGQPISMQASFEDITTRKRADEALRELGERYRGLIDNVPEIIFIIDLQGKLTFVSRQAKELLGYESAEAINMSVLAFIPEEEHQKVLESIQRGMAGEKLESLQVTMIKKSGERLLFECSFTRVYQAGRVIGAQGTAVDITERKRAEDALRDSEVRYRTLFEHSADGILIADLETKAFKYANPAVCRMLGYTAEEMRTIGVADIHPKDALPHVVTEFEAQTRGEKALATDLPCLRKDGTILYADVNATTAAIDGRPCLVGFFRDTTVRKRTQEALIRSLEATLSALSHAAEMRDPYTAGHQRRVTELAIALARKLGFPDDESDTLRIAGLLHDIGKLGVPAEILSKPSVLSPIEFELIRTHPQAAYEILADAAFPDLVAEIVLQHHERLDGSGYPRRISGDDILLEARILGVADVVEAMASHRPYRPALGIEAALVEIRAGRGTRYDQRVADACAALFESGEFSFSPTSGSSQS